MPNIHYFAPASQIFAVVAGMCRCVFAVSMSCLLLIGGMPASHQYHQNDSILWTKGKTYDFGNIQAGVLHTATFPFTNISTDTLTIETVRTTCGCTATQYTTTPVPPHGEGYVEVTYYSEQRRSFRKKIMVFFDKRRRPDVLYIIGNQE